MTEPVTEIVEVAAMEHEESWDCKKEFSGM